MNLRPEKSLYIYLFRCLILSALILLESISRAETELPIINSHATENIAIYQADSISLDLAATGGDLTFSWSRNGKEECSEAKCIFETATWSVGIHQIMATVSNILSAGIN